MRIGHGYDLHRLEAQPPNGNGRPFVLGGIPVEHASGPIGHSDGDALLHAITDAILGALGEPDIGRLFSDTDPANEGVDSSVFLEEAVRRMQARDLVIGNLDATVICESPRIAPIADAMKTRIAELLECPQELVNIKGKTHEKVDAVGEGRAIEVHVVVLLVPVNA
ncbi:MAG: 2-C-methyl-D-erythritol 2,4-cyclodiphosphate synthase [Planctomycetota bacterium]|nr:2-C-methyl-D-erythritol 2,4-cyclodiphosphate synthase [Planctomycetota bacterium]